MSGTLPVGNGGTGATTLTGILKGNGAGAFTAVTAPAGTIVGTTDTQTLSGKTLSTPKISYGQFDVLRDYTSNYNVFEFGVGASDTNWIKASGSGTGVDVSLAAVGVETNVSLDLISKGTGTVKINGVTVSMPSTTETLTNKTLTSPALIGTIKEDVYTITDGAGFAIDPTNGSVQLVTLGASRTPTQANWDAGESVTLMVADGTAYTITWSTIGVVWVGGTAPTLATTGYTVIQLWKVSTTIYGTHVGDVA